MMPREERSVMNTVDLAAAFKALGDPTRLAVFELIRKQEDICACKILEDLDISQPTLSHHVKQLCAAGLVSCRKEGRWMHYSVDRETASQLAAFLLDSSASE